MTEKLPKHPHRMLGTRGDRRNEGQACTPEERGALLEARAPRRFDSVRVGDAGDLRVGVGKGRNGSGIPTYTTKSRLGDLNCDTPHAAIAAMRLGVTITREEYYR